MENKVRFKKWELALMIVGAVLFSSAGYVLFNDVPIKLQWLGLDERSAQQKVATLEVLTGVLKRKTTIDPAFREIPVKTEIYNHDTVVTGSKSLSKITFDDGSYLELQENTMMILSSEGELSFTGISRIPKVEVLAGNLKGTAKNGKLIIKTDQGEISLSAGNSQSVQVATSASLLENGDPFLTVFKDPIDIDVKVLTPRDRTLLKIPPRATLPEYSLNFKWKVNPPIPLELEFMKKNGKEFESLAKRTITPNEEGVGSLNVILKNPGWYVWKLRQTRETEQEFRLEPIVNLFALSRTFTGIEILPPLYAGRELASNQYDKDLVKDFDVKLRWSAWNDVDDYKLKIMTAEKDGEIISEETVDGTEYQLISGKILTKAYYYQVSSKLENGFEVVSDVVPVRFNFLPPKPIVPEPNLEISLPLPAADGVRLPFEWSKTSFTTKYILEISKDRDFKKVILKKTTAQNTFTLHIPRPGSLWWLDRSTAWWKQIGTYYWRVMSIGQGNVPSEASEVRSFTVTN